jgi:uncharacterized protein
MTHLGTVTELWRYPVKSMGGERVRALEVDWRGAAGDRVHTVRHVHRGRDAPLTARQAAGLLRWGARYPGGPFAADAPPPAELTAPDGTRHDWGDAGLEGRLAADLGRPVSLRRDPAGEPDLPGSLLVTTRATHVALEAELGARVDLRRFRTNLHLDVDAPAWAELGWEGGRLELADGIVLRLLHPCVRCVIPTRDPDTAARWPALLKHLHAAHGTRFGINARVESGGRVAEGAAVRVHAP